MPGSKLIDIDLRRPDGVRAQWDTRIAAADGTAHVVYVDAVSGQVARSRVESDQDSGDKRELVALLNSTKISPQVAASTATGRRKGTVSAIGLENSDGGPVRWSVDLMMNDGGKAVLDIDSATGSVVGEQVDLLSGR
ncbi:peptidase M4 [Streptomyces sp. NPDC006283]|uniref:PepSY domain-containing protein n=1 Tax=Streptomyces sp. NPDC006283 TaxID=3156741 RepID=UPI0033AEA9CE